MQASFFLDACRAAGINFYTGVPDSFLRGLCDELFSRYGTDGKHHLVAANEGGAIGLCAGHYLSTGKPALCYMQNSGLGNAVNPLASLMDPAVYAIPCLLVIGWRGEPGTKDEPQHVKQGQITLGQLDLMGIPYLVLGPESADQDFLDGFFALREAMNRGRPAAVVVRKGALKTDALPDYGNGNCLSRERAAEVILSLLPEESIVVSTTGKLSREIFEIRERCGEGHQRDFLTVGSMGHASMIALGIAREKPDRPVWCIDGDGAFLMHMGSLPVIANSGVRNFYHVVIDNAAHETVGGMPVCSGHLDLTAIALASGYRQAASVSTEEGLAERVAALCSEPAAGPSLLAVRCACGARLDLGRPTTTPIQNRDAFMSFLKEF